MSGTWDAVGRGWRAFAPAVLVGAAAQAALVVGDPEPAGNPVFAVLAIVSFVAVTASVVVVAGGALAATDRRPMRITGSLVLWSVVLVLVMVAASVIAAPLVLLAVLLALLLLPAAADGRANPFGSGFAVFRGGALRAVGAMLVALLLLLASWAIAFALGFFVTGVLASAITWLWFGIVGVVLLCWFSARYRRATPR
ncbi:hypothetical protein BH10ACT7_BH10ACT7_25100 [soil metagenome]